MNGRAGSLPYDGKLIVYLFGECVESCPSNRQDSIVLSVVPHAASMSQSHIGRKAKAWLVRCYRAWALGGCSGPPDALQNQF